ncbi:tellurite resistance protein TerA [Nakamurella sp. UYEF19]|uniref:TerD family protein n=1 Tax=Nakamurella sp. UYEF19 TaxID=1756392 RepID=UPI003396BA53
MTTLTRGANTAVPAAALDVAVTGAVQGSVDLMVFQLGADRKVRSDHDFVFFNQPTSPEGAVTLAAADRVTVALTGVPADIEVLAVAVSLADEIPGTLADVTGLGVGVSGPGLQIDAPVLGLTTERAAVLIEIYRRGSEWKLRNVSAGWTEGLAALAQEHGVSVDGEAAAPTPPAAPTSKGPAVDLGKRTGAVNLAKGQRVSIEKSPVITASVSWPPSTDYDVYALVRYRDGHTETVSQFGTKQDKKFQTSTRDQAVRHLGDIKRDKKATEAVEKVEIRINPDIVAVVPVAYSAQSNGAGSFFQYKVSMAIDNGLGTRVQVDAANGHQNPMVFTCVPGIIVNAENGIDIVSLELYSAEGSENRPIVNADLSITMDAGPTNAFK